MNKQRESGGETLTELGGWYASMVICKNCGHKWSAVYPDTTKPSELQCPKCGWFGAEIMKGENQ